jgi:hypothetical protein
MSRRAYIAGPMSGLPQHNYPAFLSAEATVAAAGFVPINPAKNGLPADAPWERHMRRDIGLLVTCDVIVMLPGWSQSRGATLENKIARTLGMKVIDLEDVGHFQEGRAA